ncbi:MAG: hypothetical protein GX200_00440 [Firmicutes bacterium]|nr:hypothetical protein [Bacillota bacterium]
MAPIVIAVKHVTPGLKEKLEECLFFFRESGNIVALVEKDGKEWPHFFCHLQPGETVPGSPVLRSMLADRLALYVVHEQAPYFLAHMVSRYYYYFPKEERQQIINLAKANYETDPAKDEGGPVYAGVLQCLQEYLEQNDYLNLHGLITFRMQQWMKFLRKTVDKAVDEFLMEKEYQEFVKLLKYFVALQEPKIKQVHVLLDEEGRFRFLDEDCRPLTQQQEIAGSGDDGVSDEEDKLVSMLITMAPHRIILHKNVCTLYPKAADTLRHVFENRVVLCKHCKLCHDAGRNLL